MNAPRSTHTLLLVPSANHAVQGERALLAGGVACRLLPVPRYLSSQCGVCLSVAAADRHRAEAVLAAASTRIEAVHDVDLDGIRGDHGTGGAREHAAGTSETTHGKETR